MCAFEIQPAERIRRLPPYLFARLNALKHQKRQADIDIIDLGMVAAMESLTEEFRTIIILSDLEGLTYEEMAEVLDVPQGTVESRLHRARADLRRRFKGYL